MNNPFNSPAFIEFKQTPDPDDIKHVIGLELSIVDLHDQAAFKMKPPKGMSIFAVVINAGIDLSHDDFTAASIFFATENIRVLLDDKTRNKISVMLFLRPNT